MYLTDVPSIVFSKVAELFTTMVAKVEEFQGCQVKVPVSKDGNENTFFFVSHPGYERIGSNSDVTAVQFEAVDKRNSSAKVMAFSDIPLGTIVKVRCVLSPWVRKTGSSSMVSASIHMRMVVVEKDHEDEDEAGENNKETEEERHTRLLCEAADL